MFRMYRFASALSGAVTLVALTLGIISYNNVAPAGEMTPAVTTCSCSGIGAGKPCNPPNTGCAMYNCIRGGIGQPNYCAANSVP